MLTAKEAWYNSMYPENAIAKMLQSNINDAIKKGLFHCAIKTTEFVNSKKTIHSAMIFLEDLGYKTELVDGINDYLRISWE